MSHTAYVYIEENFVVHQTQDIRKAFASGMIKPSVRKFSIKTTTKLDMQSAAAEYEQFMS